MERREKLINDAGSDFLFGDGAGATCHSKEALDAAAKKVNELLEKE